MKKFFAILLTAAMLMCMSAGFALAAGYVYITDTTNVRTGPGLGYTKIATLREGSTVPFLQQTKYDSRGVAWYRVSVGTNDEPGWVVSSYAMLSEFGGEAYYSSGANAGEGKESNYNFADVNTVTATADVNVRKGPGTKHAIVTTMYADDVAIYLGNTSYDERGVAWYQVSFGNETGWASSMYSVLENAGMGGYRWVRIVDGKCNVRKGPGLSFKTMGTAYEDDALFYLGNMIYDDRGVAWYNVIYDNTTGWVSSMYAEVEGDEMMWYKWVEIVDGKCNVRVGPGLGYKSIGTAYEGETLTFLGDYSVDERGVNWYRVSFDGENGWVSSTYAELY